MFPFNCVTYLLWNDQEVISVLMQKYTKEDIYLVEFLPVGMKEEMRMPGCIGCGGYLEHVESVTMWYMCAHAERYVVHACVYK